MKDFEDDSLRIEIRDKPAAVAIHWCGESEARDPASTLGPFLDGLVPSLRKREVTLYFDALRYMNSSTVTPIMEFLRKLSEVASAVTVLYDGRLQWQATSFRAMRVVARKWENVEVRETSNSRPPG